MDRLGQESEEVIRDTLIIKSPFKKLQFGISKEQGNRKTNLLLFPEGVGVGEKDKGKAAS